MSNRKCKNWFEAYIEFTEDFESPPMFNKWIALLTLSVAAGRKVWLEEANNCVWPNLYVVLVGPSGIGKGQAMREALPFIELTGVPRSPDQVTIQQVIVDMSERFRLVLQVSRLRLICCGRRNFHHFWEWMLGRVGSWQI